jgi:hypothetical protein
LELNQYTAHKFLILFDWTKNIPIILVECEYWRTFPTADINYSPVIIQSIISLCLPSCTNQWKKLFFWTAWSIHELHKNICLWCCLWMCPHRASWNVCLTSAVAIELATFGLLVQCSIPIDVLGAYIIYCNWQII